MRQGVHPWKLSIGMALVCARLEEHLQFSSFEQRRPKEPRLLRLTKPHTDTSYTPDLISALSPNQPQGHVASNSSALSRLGSSSPHRRGEASEKIERMYTTHQVPFRSRVRPSLLAHPYRLHSTMCVSSRICKHVINTESVAKEPFLAIASEITEHTAASEQQIELWKVALTTTRCDPALNMGAG